MRVQRFMGILVETPTWSDFVPLVSRWKACYNLRVYVPGGRHNTSLERTVVVVTDMSYDPGSCQLRNTRPSYSMDQIPAFYPAKQINMACQRHDIAIIQEKPAVLIRTPPCTQGLQVIVAQRTPICPSYFFIIE